MDSLPEDMTMRTLIKGMIAEEVPQSIVRPETHRRRSRKKTSTPKKLIDVSVQQSPTMVLRSQMKAKVRSCQLTDAAKKVAAQSSKKQTTGKNSLGLKKAKTVRAISQEALDDYTPRGLLKKFMQTELESSLVKVANPTMKSSVQKKSQSKTKLLSGSNNSFGLSLSVEDDCTSQKQKINVSEFEKATQKSLQQTVESQQNEQVEQCDKSSRLPDISTIVGLINPDFEESTTKPILCRRPIKHRVINENDFEEGVHNYLQQGKELEEVERIEPFEKTSGLTDISRIVGSINFDTDESVSKPVLSRRPRRDKLISEDDFEEGVLFYLQQAKEKPLPEVQDTTSDSTEKEKSSAHTQHDELAATELYTSPWPAKSNGMKAVATDAKEMKNAFDLNSRLDLEKTTELSVRVEEESVKVANSGRASSHSLFKEKNLSDTDHQIVYAAGKHVEVLATGEESMDHEFKVVTDAGLNLMPGEQESTISRHSEGVDTHEGMLVDEVGDKVESDKMEAETTESEGVKNDEVNDKRMEDDEMNDERVEGDEMDDERVEGDEMDDERVEGDEMDDERVEGDEMDDERVEGDEMDDERVEGDEADDERVEGDEADDERVEGDEADDERMEGDEADDERVEGDEADDERVEGDEADDERVEGDEADDECVEGDEADDEQMEGDEADDDDEEEPDEVPSREELPDSSESEEGDSKMRLAFQQSDQGFRSSPLLTTPHFLKILDSKAHKPLVKVRQNPKKTPKARKKTSLPSSFVKSVFTHYAKMRVKKETFTVVEQCLELYFKQLCDDVDVYTKHAKRRTIEKEDLELLMKRQGFVTAKMPLNILIERHLSMECREKLIPMAVSGSKIIPNK
ncbi:ribosomal L1 domain-containing protein CG13096 [Hemiscyllium ocellatum]|uniref:ribosomal L1 domain-containing protein CG13096 n=1 Tax=Hemiscyllium ocellatum TaxID=170820 RepID=UPI00296734FD|nr:ribosomal L1 domain-containing protein CG13096 [Hemiscyllium ocellatum]